MKSILKQFITATIAMSGLTSSAAIPNDRCTYKSINGFSMINVWTASANINNAEWHLILQKLGRYSDGQNTGIYNRSRMCATHNGIIYISSGAIITEGEGNAAITHEYWDLVSFDLYTGEYLNTVQMTLNGKPFEGLLAAMNIGTDDYGNIWVSGYNSGLEGTTLKVYLLNVDTGELTLCGSEIEWSKEEAAYRSRIDYCDVAGDVTGMEANGYYGAVGILGAPYAYRFILRKGTSTWKPGMEGYAAWPANEVLDMSGNHINSWGDTSVLTWMEGYNDRFYADGRGVRVSQYSCSEGLPKCLGDFSQADSDCMPIKTGDDTGAWDWKLNGKMWLGYGTGQGGEGSTAMISMMGSDTEHGTFSGMTPAWHLPANGVYSHASNGGGIHQVFCAEYVTDSNGKEGAYIVHYYHQNVLAVFFMGEDGHETFAKHGQMGSISTILNDNQDDKVKYYNLQGVEVENPSNGIFIKRQGNNTTKIIM